LRYEQRIGAAAKLNTGHVKFPAKKPVNKNRARLAPAWHMGGELFPSSDHSVDEAVMLVLFVSMMSAIQCHPKLKPMYERMVAAGKPKKVAIVACMRKQITTLNTMVKNNNYWDENMT
jgi:hypothetical protein